MALSAGGVVGALAYTAIGSRFRRRTAYVGALVGTSVAVVGMAFLPPLFALLVFGFVAGALYGPINPIINIAMQERTPGRPARTDRRVDHVGHLRRRAGRVPAAGPLINAVGLQAAFLLFAGGLVAVAFGSLAVGTLHGLDGSAVSEAPRRDTGVGSRRCCSPTPERSRTASPKPRSSSSCSSTSPSSWPPPGRWAGLFVRVGQPRVVGEIVSGILLGPTLLGGEIASDAEDPGSGLGTGSSRSSRSSSSACWRRSRSSCSCSSSASRSNSASSGTAVGRSSCLAAVTVVPFLIGFGVAAILDEPNVWRVPHDSGWRRRLVGDHARALHRSRPLRHRVSGDGAHPAGAQPALDRDGRRSRSGPPRSRCR